MNDKWFRVESNVDVIYFRAEDIASIQTRTATGKPCGWQDGVAALVSLKGRDDVLDLGEQAWGQMKAILGIEG